MILTSQQAAEKVLDPVSCSGSGLTLLLNRIDDQIHQSQSTGETMAVQFGGPAGRFLYGSAQPAGKIFLAAPVEA